MVSLKRAVLLGAAAPAPGLVSLVLCLAAAPDFSWTTQALSDLGHSAESSVAVVFNVGIHASGLLLTVCSALTVAERFRGTGALLTMTGYFMQLVAVLNEAYGRAHTAVSVLFLLSAAAAVLAYAVEGRSRLAAAALAVGGASWVPYLSGLLRGPAIPEIVSIILTLAVYLQVLSKLGEEPPL